MHLFNKEHLYSYSYIHTIYSNKIKSKATQW